MKKDDKPAYSFIVYEEARKRSTLKSGIKKSTGFRKNDYESQYEMTVSMEEKSILDEINRRNLTTDYGV